ncbi:MAG TPA: flagellar export chaperone FliS [Telluria sp.]
MFGSRHSGVAAYAKIGIETGVTAASPHKLIVMLFDGALVAVISAMRHMQAGEIAAKSEAITKAMLIVSTGLRASLDKKAGGNIAEGLDSLYHYMVVRLMEANAKNDEAALKEVQQLLTELRDAWNAIGADTARPANDIDARTTSARG